jgi:hypothetical protein
MRNVNGSLLRGAPHTRWANIPRLALASLAIVVGLVAAAALR